MATTPMRRTPAVPISTSPIAYPKPDGKISFDRLSSVFLSGTNHAEDQPCHLQVADMELQKTSELGVFGGPSARYCPAGSMNGCQEEGRAALCHQLAELRPLQDLRHQGPQQNITWVTPEGGGGPTYPNM
jgi:electron-transferring-flavoprotein dehydrogenase